MLVYILIIALIFLTSFISKTSIKSREKQEKVILIVGVFALFFVSAFRSSSVGLDTNGYMKEYEKVLTHDLWDFSYIYFEIGYVVLMKLCALLGFSTTMFFVVAYALVYIPLFFFFKKTSHDATLSLLIYSCFTFFSFNLSGIRNSIALSICLLAYLCLRKRTRVGIVQYVLLVLLACLFHKSSIVFFVSFFAVYFKFNIKVAMLYGIITGILLLFPTALFDFAKDVLDKNVSVGSIELGGSFLVYSVTFALALMFLINKRRSLSKYDASSFEFMDVSRQTLILSDGTFFMYLSFLSLILVGSAGTMIRASIFFQVFITTVLPQILAMMESRARIVAKTVIVILLLAYFYLTFLTSTNLSLIPYTFVWD